MDPRERSSDPDFPEPPTYRFLPGSPADSTHPTERLGATSNTSRHYGRHAAGDAYSPQQLPAQTQLSPSAQTLHTWPQQPERPERAQRRGTGAVWLSVLLLLVAGVALLAAFLWITDGGSNGGEGPAATPVGSSDVNEFSKSPSLLTPPPPAESLDVEPEVAPEVPPIPTPSPDQLQEWGEQLNDDINGLINDLQHRLNG